jgi:hypothetical protein
MNPTWAPRSSPYTDRIGCTWTDLAGHPTKVAAGNGVTTSTWREDCPPPWGIPNPDGSGSSLPWRKYFTLTRASGANIAQWLINEAASRLPQKNPYLTPFSPQYNWVLAGRETWIYYPASGNDSLAFPTLTSSIDNDDFDIHITASLASTVTQVEFYSGDTNGGTICKGLPTQPGDCGFKYVDSSKPQPGHAFDAGIAVTWSFTFTSSDGSDVAIAPLTLTNDFPLQVATESTWVTGDDTTVTPQPK